MRGEKLEEAKAHKNLSSQQRRRRLLIILIKLTYF